MNQSFKRWQAWQWAAQAAMVATVVLLAMVFPRHFAFTAVAENWAADSRASLFARPQPQHDGIVVLAITEETLAGFTYRFPIDRGFLARTLDTLAAAGARAVGLDILFDQPTEPGNDEAFRQAARRFPGPVVVGWTDRQTGLTERQAAFQARYLDGIAAGYSNTLKDVSDSTIRRIFPGRVEADGTFRPGFVGLLAKSLGIEPPAEPVPIVFRIGETADAPAFRTFPAHALAMLPKAWFKDKIVLIGADLPFEDRHRTPLVAGFGAEKGVMPGVLVHTHALAQMLDRVVPPRHSLAAELAVAVVLAAIGMGLGLIRRALPLRLALALAVMAAFWGMNALLFSEANLALPILSPTIAFAIMMALSGYYAAYLREAETRFIRDAFSRYVAPGLVARLQENPDNLVLGGEKREMTVLFTDVEGFTTLSEGLDASVLVAVLNEYLDGMVDCVHRHGGMVDKFIGDAVMAIFGAPYANPDHARLGVLCALEMQAFAIGFQQRQQAAGIAFGRTRIGVHSGTAVVGNIGGSKRFDYTAIGDIVNTASRLEGINKHFGTAIIVSEATASACALPMRPVGRIVVKGRHEALGAFTPIAQGDEALTLSYAKAYQLLAEGRSEASAAFRDLRSRFPDDALVRYHMNRLEQEPPSDLLVMKDK